MAEVEKPIKMTESVVKKLEEVFALDGSVEEACYYANISRQSYYNWIKSFPDMLERFDSLRQRPFLKARQTVVKSLDNPEMALKYLERKKKDEFSTRQDITSNNEVIKIIPLLSLDEIRQHNSNPEDNQTNKPN
jgi:hypothetical protein